MTLEPLVEITTPVACLETTDCPVTTIPEGVQLSLNDQCPDLVVHQHFATVIAEYHDLVSDEHEST